MFRRGHTSSPSRQFSEQAKIWVREALSLGEGDGLSVVEIACGEPECGGSETIILIMKQGEKTRACKVPKALSLLTQDDVVVAVKADA